MAFNTTAASIDDYATGCARGRALALQVIDRMRATDFPPAIGYAVRDLFGRDLTRVEVGFFHQIAEVVLAKRLAAEA